MPGVGEPWDELEYRELFEAYPLGGSDPSGDGLRRIARRLDRSVAAIRAQWDDARGHCRGNQSAASDGLQSYLDRTGACRG